MEGLKHMLAWCLVIDYSILIVWAVFSLIGREWFGRTWGSMFDIPPEKVRSINFLCIAIFKMGVIIFNLVPYLALRIMS